MKKWVMVLAVAALLVVVPVVNAQEEEYEPSYGVIFSGFSGLLDLPTSETVQKGKFSLGGFHRNIDREFGDVDVNTAYATFGIGVTEKVELGFAIMPIRQADYDDTDSGRFSNDFPLASSTIEEGFGDILAGVKFRFMDFDNLGSGLAGAVSYKFATGNVNRGLSTGGADFDLSLIGTGRSGNAFQFTGDFGLTFKGDANPGGSRDKIDLANEIHWGLGAAVPARGFIRGIVEFSGITHINENTFSIVDGMEVKQNSHMDMTLGIKLHANGFGFAGGYKRLLGTDKELIENHEGWTMALTYTDWDKPVVAPPPPDVPKPVVNHDPTATIKPEKSWAYVNESIRLDADVTDPDGDAIKYNWSTASGTISGKGPWVNYTPPENMEGAYKVTVNISDGRGGTTSHTTVIKIKENPLEPFWLDVILFELNKYKLTPEAMQVLDMMAAHMKKYPNLRVRIGGHTCSIGGADFNLALGYHRATAIKKYLVEAGVDASRLKLVSYGENRPTHDNSEEETRQYNRRGAFTFSFVDSM
ncbi:OmpA family protein [Acidobacteriota bacterium]